MEQKNVIFQFCYSLIHFASYTRLRVWHVQCIWSSSLYSIMTSSNGNISRVTSTLWGEYTVHRWIPLIKASDADLWCLLWSAPEQTVSIQSRRWWFDTPWRPLCPSIIFIFAYTKMSWHVNAFALVTILRESKGRRGFSRQRVSWLYCLFTSFCCAVSNIVMYDACYSEIRLLLYGYKINGLS